ncbi:hypothetical protein ACK8OR_02275 [Jannaschia sp. KMU-145]|uniref:hypothetical protein n=1 Tax=Jannaschia halovivens TaxID=3388667 RepID=UPI00396B0278
MIASLAAALILVAVHWLTPRLTFLSNRPRSRWLSFAGGASIGYVFLHLLPELAHGAELVGEDTALGFGIWGVALAALVGFYGIERMVQSDALRRRTAGHEEEPGTFGVHLASFVVYNLVTGYLLADRAELWLFVAAMALHLLVTDFGLLEAFRAGYMRIARLLLSAALLVGWVVGTVIEVPETWIMYVLAVLGGGVILNVLKEELPEERESRFAALVAGVVVFAALVWLDG